MSSRDPWESLPNLSGVRSHELEESRVGDAARFYASVSSGQIDPVTGRILNVPFCRSWGSSGTTIPVNTWTPVNLQSNADGSDLGMRKTNLPTRIYAPVDAVYWANACYFWPAPTAGNQRDSVIALNRAGGYAGGDAVAYNSDWPAAGTYTVESYGAPVLMRAGDYVELFLYQNDTTPLVTVPLGSNAPSLSLIFVSSLGSDNT